MIRFSLRCKRNHAFEGWFAGNEDYDKQLQAGLIACPVCGSAQVAKTLMAPNVMTAAAKAGHAAGAALKASGESGGSAPEAALQKLLLLRQMQARKLEVLRKLQSLARKMRENAENVGDKFAEEARKMHFGEAEKRSVYGQAKPEEVQSLREEGIDVLPLPRLPEDNH